MTTTGDEWLALNQETVIEPDLPICDPHHHFWDFRTERYPYERYLLHELSADVGGGHNVLSTVFVEARSMYRTDGPQELKPVGEIEFVQGLAAASASGLYGRTKVAAAIVGHANLNLGDRVEPVLDNLLQASPNRFRGVRHSVTWDDNPEIENTALHKIQGQLSNETFRAGAKVLSDKGLSFEAWLFAPQLLELAEFAKAVPDLTIILNHIGGLVRIGPYANNSNEVLENWRDGITAVAECSNVHVKLGGMGMRIMGFDWEKRSIPVGSDEMSESIAPFMHYCIEKFGPDRAMFESNFPVDKMSFSYNVMYNAFKKLSKEYSQTERAAMFHDNATSVYRI